MPEPYKTIILDLGGVLIDVDYDASARAFAALGHPDFNGLYTKARQADIFDHFETGALSTDGFRNTVRGLLDDHLSDDDIDACWNAMLGTIPREHIALVHRLKQRYQVLLLSNTNAIHVKAFEAIIARDLGIQDFKGIFHGAYYSNELGMRKPNAETFLHVIGMHHAEPSSTLFIDDSIQHVIGARGAGLHAAHLDLDKEDLPGLVRRLALIE